ncbi:hypothetical protein [Embleya sp. NPDC059259]|uniref:hypothetical protein n=1 Tax=unclassified Embleya TaxID=2699296 RepID=UPI0036B268FA
MSRTPSTVGIHRLSPAQGVAFTNAGDVARLFLPALRLAESTLLPGSNLGRAVFEWVVPGEHVSRTLEHESGCRAWLETVPLALGEPDARLHTSPIGSHTTGPLSLIHPATGFSAVFPAYEAPSVDAQGVFVNATGRPVDTPPLTLGVVTAAPDGIVVTDRGVWHTLVPEYPPLVGFGTNLAVHLAHLAPVHTALPPEMYRLAVANWWVGVVATFGTRTSQHCPCGRTTREHRPSWHDLRIAAAASGQCLSGRGRPSAGRPDPTPRLHHHAGPPTHANACRRLSVTTAQNPDSVRLFEHTE